MSPANWSLSFPAVEEFPETPRPRGADSNALKPLGVGVVIEARHLCMMMRGVEKQHSSTITSSMLGSFRKKEARDEFLSLTSDRKSRW